MSIEQKYPSNVTAKGMVYFFILKNVICRLVCWLWVRKISGIEKIPRRGPFLIVCNHQSHLDFMVLTFAFRSIRFLSSFIKDAYHDVPCLDFFLKELAQIRVDRNNKLKSIDEAIRVLSENHVVVIFPEGTRIRSGKIGKFYRGVELIIKNLPHVRIVPVGISGARKIWSPKHPWPNFFGGRQITFSVGDAMELTNFEEMDAKQFADNVRGAVISLVK